MTPLSISTMTGQRMRTYSVSELCEIMGCESERWVIKRVRNGTFPARKIVRDIRFTEADVNTILEICAFKTGAKDDIDSFIPQLSERSKRRAS